jgi:hypothetical protein
VDIIRPREPESTISFAYECLSSSKLDFKFQGCPHLQNSGSVATLQTDHRLDSLGLGSIRQILRFGYPISKWPLYKNILACLNGGFCELVM